MRRSRISLWTSCSRPSGLCLGRSWSGFPGSLLGGLRPLGGLLANLVLLACHSLLVGRPLRKKLLWIAPLIVSRFRSLSEGGHRRGPQHVMPATAALLSDAPAPRAAMLSSAARTSKSPSSSRRVLSMYRLSSLWSRGPIPTATRCCLPRHPLQSTAVFIARSPTIRLRILQQSPSFPGFHCSCSCRRIPFCPGNRKPAHLARPHVFKQCAAAEITVHAAGDEIVECRRRAAIGHLSGRPHHSSLLAFGKTVLYRRRESSVREGARTRSAADAARPCRRGDRVNRSNPMHLVCVAVHESAMASTSRPIAF
jgi:hypothetical protein